MADPRPLFYVTAVVVAGLVVWVLSVLLRPGPAWKLAAPGDAAVKPPEAAGKEASASGAPIDAAPHAPPDHESPKNS